MNLTKHNHSWAPCALAVGLMLNGLAVLAAPARLTPLVQPGKWPEVTHGDACEV